MQKRRASLSSLSSLSAGFGCRISANAVDGQCCLSAAIKSFQFTNKFRLFARMRARFLSEKWPPLEGGRGKTISYRDVPRDRLAESDGRTSDQIDGDPIEFVCQIRA